MSDTEDVLGGLPGEAVVRAGLADLKSGRRSIPAWLVEIARTRLSRAGVISAPAAPHSPETTAELELYRLLRIEGGDAYARYNALIRELVSFESALDQRLKKRQAAK
jgi:hypothetical protein